MTQPVVLVSLLVGHASEMPYLQSAVNSLATLAKSDFAEVVEGNIVTLINGMGAGDMQSKAEQWLGMFGALEIEPENLGIPAGRNHVLRAVLRQGWIPDYVLEIDNDHASACRISG